MSQDKDTENMRNELEKLANELMEKTTVNEIESYLPKIKGISAYLSYYDIQQLINWNRKLANATILLAFFTLVLAISTVIIAYLTYLNLSS